MARNTLNVDERRLHPFLIDVSPVSMLCKITLGLRQMLQKFCLQRLSATLLRELNCASGIVNHLHGLKAGKFVEKPPATRVHQQRMSLHFQKPQSQDLLVLAEFLQSMIREKRRPRCLRPVQNHPDVIVPCLPWIFQQPTEALLEDRCEPVPQPVQSRTQRHAPLLVPGMTAGIASAVGTPSLHTVHTTP